MSVIIKNLDMPIGCQECKFFRKHMFDMVDEINDGIMDPFTWPSNADFTAATICAFDPHLSQFKTEYYLRDEWLNAEVINFFVKDKLAIIWIRNENDNESDID